MLKRTFIRLIVLGSLAFTLSFVLVSAQKARQSANSGCTETETKTADKSASGEFILESRVGSLLIDIK
jgi:cytochrome oxidase Cu insertion factor (SCO1/SenC/PrrC family)